jgi:hypothetical protein
MDALKPLAVGVVCRSIMLESIFDQEFP